MASVTPRERRATSRLNESLRTILSDTIPVLPVGSPQTVVKELRAMKSPTARAVWRHEGWAALYGWVTRHVPDCDDPIAAAVHALRRVEAVRADPAAAESIREEVLSRARSSTGSLGWRTVCALDFDPAEQTVPPPSLDSYVPDASELLARVDVRPDPAAWALVSPAIDITTDWWNELAERSGLIGNGLVEGARRSMEQSSEQRLRRHFKHTPGGRPLVALLLGSDQWGRRARASGADEVGLLWSAMATRQAKLAGHDLPEPPKAVIRAWEITLRLIGEAVHQAGDVLPPTRGLTAV